MVERQFKKLWNGLASVRDYELDEAIKKGGMVFLYKEKKMTLDAEKLKKMKFQCHKTKVPSKIYRDQFFTLYDFVFIDDKERSGKEDKQLKLI